MPSEKPKDVERIIHEALEKLGWDTEPNKIIERVKRLNLGLPAEDEFSVLCGWLGQCNLIHKLDQQQYPVTSKDEYQVPDLLAEFVVNEQTISVCI